MLLLFIVGAAVLLIQGWKKWATSPKRNDITSWCSLIGFGLATASLALAVYSLAYAYVIGGFPYYDPRLLRFYRWGGCLSFSGLVASIAGMWRTSTLRWYAPALATLMFLMWAAAAMAE